MVQTQAMLKVADLMANMRPVTGGRYVLCAIDRQLKIIPFSKRPTPNSILYIFSSRSINNGLTSPQWNAVYRSLRHFISKGLL